MRKVRLKDIGTFYSGLSGKSKKDFSDGNALLATYRNIFNNPVLNLDIKDTVVIGNGEKQNEVMYGDILFTGSSETPEEAGMSSVVMSEPKEKIYLNSFCFGFRLNNIIEILPSYMGHLLRSEPVRKAISKTAFGVTRFNINKNFLSEIEIPLPPLTIQREIVSVLDSFTTLIDKMKQEVELRKKQMEYYREKLLLFDEQESGFVKIKDLFDTKNGYTPSTKNPDFWTDKGIPWVKMEDIRENGTVLSDSAKHITMSAVKGSKLFNANSIILATSATIGVHALVTVPHLSNQRFTNIYPKKEYENKIDMKYAYYYFFKIDRWCKEHVTLGNFAGVNMSDFYDYDFPLPPLSTQRSIVSTLDTFEQYISKLERLITLREKQYAYYREKLLTFE